MIKISKRQMIAAAGTLVATAVIGVPAAVVYATKDDGTAESIGANVQKEIENQFLGAINLMPTNQFGHFQKSRIEDHEEKLTQLRKTVENVTREFNLKSKTRMPIYGIINDVLNVGERFFDKSSTAADNWKNFSNRVNDAVKAINGSKWDDLEEILFDISGNGAHRILSQSYGIKRSDVDDSNPVITGIKNPSEYTDDEKDKYETINFGINHSFTSFKECIDGIKSATEPQEAKTTFINTIVGVLNMMTGTPITLAGNIVDGHGTYTTPDFVGTTPRNSFVYMVLNMEDPNAVSNLAALGDAWKEKILPSWNERYRSIDQFFNPAHEPVSSTGDIKDKADIDAFNLYDTVFFNNHSTMGDLNSSIESFLDGDPITNNDLKNLPTGTNISGIDSGAIKGTSHRYLTNWEFLRIFFGDVFSDALGQTPAITHDRDSNDWDDYMDESDATLAGSKGIKEYWTLAVENIFGIGKGAAQQHKTSYLPKIVKRKDTSSGDLKVVYSSSSLWDKLTKGTDFQDMYNELKRAQLNYQTEVNKVNDEPYRIGINIDKFTDLIDKFDLDDGWNIKVNSLLGNRLGKTDFDNLYNSIKYEKDGKTVKASADYDLLDGYVYSKEWQWILRTTDTISIQGISFKSSSKLKQFEGGMTTFRVFRPLELIEEDNDKTTITITWDAIESDKKGGSDD